jgi:hypothetical protein
MVLLVGEAGIFFGRPHSYPKSFFLYIHYNLNLVICHLGMG